MLIRRAETPDDFRVVHAMIAEMGAWDAAEVARLGLSHHTVIPTYYADDARALQLRYTSEDAGLFLCTIDGTAIGCGGFAGEGRVAEIEKVYVRPEARGRGAGKAIMAALLGAIEERGFDRTRLVTTEFMVEALGLYGFFGFRRCAEFAPAPAELHAITVYMERANGQV